MNINQRKLSDNNITHDKSTPKINITNKNHKINQVYINKNKKLKIKLILKIMQILELIEELITTSQKKKQQILQIQIDITIQQE